MNKKISTPLAILIIFLVIAVIIGISFWLCPKEETENIACTQEAKICPDGSYVSRAGRNCEFAPCPSTSLSEIDSPPSTQPTGTTTAYKIIVSEKNSPIAEFDLLKYYLEKMFGLPTKSISNIVFDIRDGEPYETIYNFSYYILVIAENDLKPEYIKGNVSVKTVKADERLILYIQNPDYCEADTDCVIRNEFCSTGAFNYYHAFHDVWGCEWVYYPEENQESLQGICDNETEHAEVSYAASKCINHRCAGQGKTITCVKGVPI